MCRVFTKMRIAISILNFSLNFTLMLNRISAFLCVVCLASCTSYQYSNKTHGEAVEMQPATFASPVTLQAIVAKNNPEAVSRGFAGTDMLVQGASLAIQGVKYLIDESKKKYVAEYKGSLTNENFYGSNSRNGKLDPEGIVFKGFVFERSFKDKKSPQLNAVKAWISVDESKLYDVYFNSKFYLKLDSLQIDYAKVKLNDKKWFLPWTWFMKKQTTFNLDFKIEITASWLDELGVIHAAVPVGYFVLPLRNIPVNPNDPARQAWYAKQSNTPIAGSSYIIPRSVTYCTDKRGNAELCYGRGDFSINVSVNESSKEGFVTKLIQQNSDALIKNLNPNDIKKLFRQN